MAFPLSLPPINWFPGHMRRARRQIADALRSTDIVIEVLDARAPWSSGNPLLGELRDASGKPSLKILNKADLADHQATEKWVKYFESSPSVRAVPARKDRSAQQAQKLLSAGLSLLPRELHSVRAMIVGVPNVGKSTLINTLAGRRKARTGNTPNVTRGQQLIRVGERITLLDTPGFLWPRLEPVECGYRLAATGAISDRVIEFENVAVFGANHMLLHYRGALARRYGEDFLQIAALDGPMALIHAVGEMRGCFGRGGRVDPHKASELFIRELRLGLLGNVTFEFPADVTTPKQPAVHKSRRR